MALVNIRFWHCDMVPRDTLQVGVYSETPVGTNGMIELRIDDADNMCRVVLTKDHARELFNWLGVYLHK